MSNEVMGIDKRIWSITKRISDLSELQKTSILPIVEQLISYSESFGKQFTDKEREHYQELEDIYDNYRLVKRK